MPDLGILGLEFLKTIVIFEISTLKLFSEDSLTHTVNFGIGSAFSKGPGFAFSEGPSTDPGPFYKVCLLQSVLKTSVKFLGKHICCSLFSINLQAFSLKFY